MYFGADRQTFFFFFRAYASAPGCGGYAVLMFTDIQSSTKLWEAHEESMKVALDIHNETIRNLLFNFGGYEVKTQGRLLALRFDLIIPPPRTQTHTRKHTHHT